MIQFNADHFRLLILDYPKQQIDDQLVGKVLKDIIVTKQLNFERASADYITLDKHDMIGTHYLVYDTCNLFQPKLVAGIRSTYATRAKHHQIQTPIADLIPLLPENCKAAYSEFSSAHPLIADCGSLVVDDQYTFKNTGLRLVDICYAMIYIHVSRMGYNHILGCTNERFRSSRWLENIGSFTDGLNFVHPSVSDPHLLIMIEKFNVPYIKSICAANEFLFRNIQELVPKNAEYMDINSAVDTFAFDGKRANNKSLKMVG